MDPSLSHFFVCGCPKSGTTWAQLLLHQHPEVSCAGESQLALLLRKISKQIEDHNDHQAHRNRAVFGDLAGYLPFPAIDHDDERFLYRALVERMLEKSRDPAKPGLRALGEKSPNLAEHLSWFGAVMPEAKFIHVIRDARDVAVSGWHHPNRDAPGARPLPFPDYALISAQVWCMVIIQARAAAAALSGRYLEVRYEALHAEPDATLDGMLRFLGVTASPAMRADCIARVSFVRLAHGREPGQEDPRAFLRKGVVGDWRNWFDASLHGSFVALAGPLLAQLGYSLLV